MRAIDRPRSQFSKLTHLDQNVVHEMAAGIVLKHLALEGKGEKSRPEKVVDVLLCAAAGCSSIEEVCVNSEEAPSPNTIRGVLKHSLELDSAEAGLNAALRENLDKSYWRKPLKVAADMHQQPYYGTPHSEQELRAGKHKAGTYQFHTFATAYVIRNGRRVTLALHFVRKGENLVSVLEALKTQLDLAHLRVGLWLADKEFAQVEALSWLQHHVPVAYVPLPLNGRKDPPTATRALAARQHSGFEPYTMQSSDHRRQLSFTLALVRHGPEQSRSGKPKEPRTLLYAIVGSHARRHLRRLQPMRISQEYSRRFGIESSYRQLRQGRGRTSSRSPLLRLLYAGLALLLRNLWVLCRWIASAHPGPGARPKKKSTFTFGLLLDWIEFYLKVHLRYRTELPLQAPSAARF